jgi:uncharacterized protein YbjT (DUF2867 family)
MVEQTDHAERSPILVTGANGLVGRALCAQLTQLGQPLRRTVRQASSATDWSVGSLDGQTDWSAALAGCRVVVHLVA